jgi:hypothetical protein
MMQRLLLALLLVAGLGAPASAQTYWLTPGGSGVNGAVGMCLNVLKQAIPCSDPGALQFTAISSVVSAALETSHVLKASAGQLDNLMVTTTTNSGYLLLLDSATDPGNGVVAPKKCISLAAAATTGISWGQFPEKFSTGITAVFSTTGCFTETQSATAYFSGQVQ